MDKKEIWKKYPEFDFVEASNLGRVRTVDRVVMRSDGRKQFVKGRILKQHLNHNGYLSVNLTVNNKTVARLSHRVIASCFLDNPNNWPEVNHKNSRRADNAVSNLEWCTHEYNMQYREKYGKALGRPLFAVNLKTGEVAQFESRSEAERQLGVTNQNIGRAIKEKHRQCGGYWFTENKDEITKEKLAEIKCRMPFRGDIIAINIETGVILLFGSQHEASHKLGVDQSHISKVIKGKIQKTHGFWFCRADSIAVEVVREKFGDSMANKAAGMLNDREVK